ncbi:MAG: hypothetical protein J6I64_01180 [Lachnospiraceae bacterium]|nr:hypothetical protein [Lachnospiraceae bacterium]
MAKYVLDWKKQYKRAMIMQLPLTGKDKILTERINRIMNFSGQKKQRKAMAVVLCMLFVLLGSTTALAAGSGVESLYAESLLSTYEDQSVIEMETTEEVILHEYEIASEDIPYVPELMVNEVLSNAQPSATFSSTITEDLWQSGRFQASAGQSIYVSVSVIPDDVEVKVGIMEPDGTWRLVIADGTINHTFALDQTGTYVVFVWNETTTTVDIYGYYVTRDSN